jgi:hypothetical protein
MSNETKLQELKDKLSQARFDLRETKQRLAHLKRVNMTNFTEDEARKHGIQISSNTLLLQRQERTKESLKAEIKPLETNIKTRDTIIYSVKDAIADPEVTLTMEDAEEFIEHQFKDKFEALFESENKDSDNLAEELFCVAKFSNIASAYDIDTESFADQDWNEIGKELIIELLEKRIEGNSLENEGDNVQQFLGPIFGEDVLENLGLYEPEDTEYSDMLHTLFDEAISRVSSPAVSGAAGQEGEESSVAAAAAEQEQTQLQTAQNDAALTIQGAVRQKNARHRVATLKTQQQQAQAAANSAGTAASAATLAASDADTVTPPPLPPRRDQAEQGYDSSSSTADPSSSGDEYGVTSDDDLDPVSEARDQAQDAQALTLSAAPSAMQQQQAVSSEVNTQASATADGVGGTTSSSAAAEDQAVQKIMENPNAQNKAFQDSVLSFVDRLLKIPGIKQVAKYLFKKFEQTLTKNQEEFSSAEYPITLKTPSEALVGDSKTEVPLKIIIGGREYTGDQIINLSQKLVKAFAEQAAAMNQPRQAPTANTSGVVASAATSTTSVVAEQEAAASRTQAAFRQRNASRRLEADDAATEGLKVITDEQLAAIEAENAAKKQQEVNDAAAQKRQNDSDGVGTASQDGGFDLDDIPSVEEVDTAAHSKKTQRSEKAETQRATEVRAATALAPTPTTAMASSASETAQNALSSQDLAAPSTTQQQPAPEITAIGSFAAGTQAAAERAMGAARTATPSHSQAQQVTTRSAEASETAQNALSSQDLPATRTTPQQQATRPAVNAQTSPAAVARQSADETALIKNIIGKEQESKVNKFFLHILEYLPASEEEQVVHRRRLNREKDTVNGAVSGAEDAGAAAGAKNIDLGFAEEGGALTLTFAGKKYNTKEEIEGLQQAFSAAVMERLRAATTVVTAASDLDQAARASANSASDITQSAPVTQASALRAAVATPANGSITATPPPLLPRRDQAKQEQAQAQAAANAAGTAAQQTHRQPQKTTAIGSFTAGTQVAAKRALEATRTATAVQQTQQPPQQSQAQQQQQQDAAQLAAQAQATAARSVSDADQLGATGGAMGAARTATAVQQTQQPPQQSQAQQQDATQLAAQAQAAAASEDDQPAAAFDAGRQKPLEESNFSQIIALLNEDTVDFRKLTEILESSTHVEQSQLLAEKVQFGNGEETSLHHFISNKIYTRIFSDDDSLDEDVQNVIELIKEHSNESSPLQRLTQGAAAISYKETQKQIQKVEQLRKKNKELAKFNYKEFKARKFPSSQDRLRAELLEIGTKLRENRDSNIGDIENNDILQSASARDKILLLQEARIARNKAYKIYQKQSNKKTKSHLQNLDRELTDLRIALTATDTGTDPKAVDLSTQELEYWQQDLEVQRYKDNLGSQALEHSQQLAKSSQANASIEAEFTKQQDALEILQASEEWANLDEEKKLATLTNFKVNILKINTPQDREEIEAKFFEHREELLVAAGIRDSAKTSQYEVQGEHKKLDNAALVEVIEKMIKIGDPSSNLQKEAKSFDKAMGSKKQHHLDTLNIGAKAFKLDAKLRKIQQGLDAKEAEKQKIEEDFAQLRTEHEKRLAKIESYKKLDSDRAAWSKLNSGFRSNNTLKKTLTTVPQTFVTESTESLGNVHNSYISHLSEQLTKKLCSLASDPKQLAKLDDETLNKIIEISSPKSSFSSAGNIRKELTSDNSKSKLFGKLEKALKNDSNNKLQELVTEKLSKSVTIDKVSAAFDKTAKEENKPKIKDFQEALHILATESLEEFSATKHQAALTEENCRKFLKTKKTLGDTELGKEAKKYAKVYAANQEIAAEVELKSLGLEKIGGDYKKSIEELEEYYVSDTGEKTLEKEEKKELGKVEKSTKKLEKKLESNKGKIKKLGKTTLKSEKKNAALTALDERNLEIEIRGLKGIEITDAESAQQTPANRTVNALNPTRNGQRSA